MKFFGIVMFILWLSAIFHTYQYTAFLWIVCLFISSGFLKINYKFWRVSCGLSLICSHVPSPNVLWRTSRIAFAIQGVPKRPEQIGNRSESLQSDSDWVVFHLEQLFWYLSCRTNEKIRKFMLSYASGVLSFITNKHYS